MGGSRRATIATASTVLFFGAVIAALLNSPGWPEIESAFFDRQIFTESLPVIVRKFGWNIFIFCVAEALVLVLALFVAVLRGLPGPLFAPLRLVAIGYTDLFRGVPTILVISLLGFGMPALQLQGVPRSDLFWGIMALVLVYGAYVAEIYRAGIESVHPSQVAAARSLGLSRWLALRHVVLPQAVRRVIPPLLNDFIGLQKDSALVAFLGFVEGLQQANLDSQATFNFTPYVALALVYLVITVPMTRYVDHLLLRQRRRREAVAQL
jgi:polar amino acid transport system permease protein